MSNAAVAIVRDDPADREATQEAAHPPSRIVEEHMLMIASILFDTLSDLRASSDDRLDIFDIKNTSAMISLSASLE